MYIYLKFEIFLYKILCMLFYLLSNNLTSMIYKDLSLIQEYMEFSHSTLMCIRKKFGLDVFNVERILTKNVFKNVLILK